MAYNYTFNPGDCRPKPNSFYVYDFKPMNPNANDLLTMENRLPIPYAMRVEMGKEKNNLGPYMDMYDAQGRFVSSCKNCPPPVGYTHGLRFNNYIEPLINQPSMVYRKYM